MKQIDILKILGLVRRSYKVNQKEETVQLKLIFPKNE